MSEDDNDKSENEGGFPEGADPEHEAFAFDKLMKVKGIFVKQKPDYLEALTYFEIENTYTVYATDSEGEMN